MDDAYTTQEADRLSRIMFRDPHSAADEMRDELQNLRPEDAVALIRKTKAWEFEGSAGNLNIRAEIDQNGCDTGFRNVTMLTPDGPEQIAEFRARPASCPDDYNTGAYSDNYYQRPGYQVDPLAAITGFLVGDLLWQRNNGRRGYGYDDDGYRSFRNREEWRESEWREHQGEFQRQWRDPDFRRDYQRRDRDGWQQNAFNNNWNPFRAQLPPQVPQYGQDRPNPVYPNPNNSRPPFVPGVSPGDGRQHIQPVVPRRDADDPRNVWQLNPGQQRQPIPREVPPAVDDRQRQLQLQQEQQRRLQEQQEQQRRQQEQPRRQQEQPEQQRRLQEQQEQQRRLQEQQEQQRRQQEQQRRQQEQPPVQRPLPTPGGRFPNVDGGTHNQPEQQGDGGRAAQIREMQQRRLEAENAQRALEAQQRQHLQQQQQQQLEESRRRTQEQVQRQLEAERQRQQQQQRQAPPPPPPAPVQPQRAPNGVDPEQWRRQHHL